MNVFVADKVVVHAGRRSRAAAEHLARLVTDRLQTSLHEVEGRTFIDSLCIGIDDAGEPDALADRIAAAIVREIHRIA